MSREQEGRELQLPLFFFVAVVFVLSFRGADHSEWNKDEMPTVCGMGMCPITTKFKGPSPTNTTGRPDIIDEAIRFFRVSLSCPSRPAPKARFAGRFFFFFFFFPCLSSCSDLSGLGCRPTVCLRTLKCWGRPTRR